MDLLHFGKCHLLTKMWENEQMMNPANTTVVVTMCLILRRKVTMSSFVAVNPLIVCGWTNLAFVFFAVDRRFLFQMDETC